jgi:hypothetical protein
MSESQLAISAQETNWFWKEVSADVREKLTDEQRRAIEDAINSRITDAQQADMRLHVGKYFLRIIAGEERRNPVRLKEERANNPIFVSKNLPLIIIYWFLMLFSTLYALAFIVNVLSYFEIF